MGVAGVRMAVLFAVRCIEFTSCGDIQGHCSMQSNRGIAGSVAPFPQDHNQRTAGGHASERRCFGAS